MFKETLTIFPPQKKFSPPRGATTEAFSLYQETKEFGALFAALYPNLSWTVPALAAGKEKKESRKDKKDKKEKKKLNSLEVQSEILLDRLLGAEYWDKGKLRETAVINTALPDLRHLVGEVAIAEWKTEYPYVLPEGSEQWFGPGYSKDMETLALNFVTALAERGILSWRAVTEAFVMKRLAGALFAAAQDDSQETYFLVSSPPEENEYNGSQSAKTPTKKNAKEKHHAFFHLMKAANGQIDVTQYRGWPNYAGILEIQEDFGAGFALEPDGSAGSQLFANVITLHFPKGAPRQAVEAYVEEVLYDKERVKQWHIRPDQLPSFTPEAEKTLWREIMGMTKAELLKAAEVLSAAASQQKPLHEVDVFSTVFADTEHSLMKDVFIPELFSLLREAKSEIEMYPQKKKKYAERLTALHQLLLTTAEQKTQWYNSNPEYSKLVVKQAVENVVKDPVVSFKTVERVARAALARHAPPSFKTLQGEYSQAREFLKLHYKYLASPDSLSASEKQRYFALNIAFKSFGFVIGSSECYLVGSFNALSPEGLALSMNLAPPAAFADLSNQSREVQEQIIENMTPEEARFWLAKYESEPYVELDLPGANQIWMVPQSYVEYGCSVDPETGKVFGPCKDPDPNSKYANGIPLDDPLEQSAVPTTKERFTQTLELLKKRAQETAWESVVDKATQKVAPSQQEEVHKLLTFLQKKLFKTSISLGDLINNDLISHQVWLDTWLAKIAALLDGPDNPVVILKQVIAEVVNSDTTTAEQLTLAAAA